MPTTLPTICLGIGVDDGVRAESPRAALDSFVRGRAGEPSDWSETDESLGGESPNDDHRFFQPADRATAGLDLSEIEVSRSEDGAWVADGACR